MDGHEAAAAAPLELPLELVDELVRLGGWRTWGLVWSKVCRRYRPIEWWLREGAPSDQSAHIVVVGPADMRRGGSINAGIARAAREATGGCRAVVLVRPGTYNEAIRMTADVSLCSLGPRGSAVVHATGWEPALAWGGYKVGKTTLAGTSVSLDAASAGAESEVCGLRLVQRNQQQQVCVYITFGSPTISQLDIVGSVLVAGRAAAPTITSCHISNSRSVGIDFKDHATGMVECCRIEHNRLAAVRIAASAAPTVSSANLFSGNLIDGTQRCDGDGDEDLDEFELTASLDAASPPPSPPAEAEIAAPEAASTDATDGAAADVASESEDECAVPDGLLDFLSEHVGDGPVSLADHAGATACDSDEEGHGFVPIRWDVSTSVSTWVADAADSLAQNGFCVLRLETLLVSADACSEIASACLDRLSALLAAARRIGIAPRRDVMRFSEVCSRKAGGMRFDMRFYSASKGRSVSGNSETTETAQEPAEEEASATAPDEPVENEVVADALPTMPAAWEELRVAVEAVVRPILALRAEASDGVRVDSAGCVTSLAGAPEQHFHPDGTAVGLVNCFVPLVPVTDENGPTELRPGSHEWVDTPYGREPRWDERKQSAVTPTLPRPGHEMLLFDYRVYHRGRANRSTQSRPVAYVAFSTRDGVSDRHNFPDVSLLSTAPAAVTVPG